MATWQFSFDLVPAAAIREQFHDIPLVITSERFDELFCWRSWKASSELIASIATILPAHPSWSESVAIWGHPDGDTIQVFMDDTGEVDSVFVRVDVRSLSHVFITAVAVLAQRFQLLIRTEDGHILRPDARELLSAIRRSPATRFVDDPVAFLKAIEARREPTD